MRISDWSSDVCSSDLQVLDADRERLAEATLVTEAELVAGCVGVAVVGERVDAVAGRERVLDAGARAAGARIDQIGRATCRERVCQYMLISVFDVSLQKT